MALALLTISMIAASRPLSPVSYTHLDVYKRQDITMGELVGPVVAADQMFPSALVVIMSGPGAPDGP